MVAMAGTVMDAGYAEPVGVNIQVRGRSVREHGKHLRISHIDNKTHTRPSKQQSQGLLSPGSTEVVRV